MKPIQTGAEWMEWVDGKCVVVVYRWNDETRKSDRLDHTERPATQDDHVRTVNGEIRYDDSNSPSRAAWDNLARNGG